MRLLFTSDWQCEWQNLDLCETALDELLASAAKYGPDAIVHAGDLKDCYNPIDARVVQFWVRAIRRIRKAGYRFIILLGNHDRISQQADSKDWLDILRAAGAETVSVPKIKEVGDGAIALLPYTSDKKLERKRASKLAYDIQAYPIRALVFHAGVQGARISASMVDRSSNTVQELKAGQYSACFGGHYHEYQKVGKNVWFIGSPFCQDWGEANTVKGYLFAEITKEV